MLIFQYLQHFSRHIKAMNKTALDQYEEVVTDALKKCSAKLRKSFITAFIQMMILYMILPKKINFTQMGHTPTIRSNASDSFLNVSLTGWSISHLCGKALM